MTSKQIILTAEDAEYLREATQGDAIRRLEPEA